MLDRAACEGLIAKVLTRTEADDATVNLSSTRREHLRFANNQVTTSGIDLDQQIEVTVSFGSRSGTASGNQLSDEGVMAVVRAAEELARVAPEDPEHMPSVGRQTYALVSAWKESDRPDATVTGVGQVIGQAANAGLVASGFAESRRTTEAVGTTNGAMAFHRHTHAQVSTTIRTLDGGGSGWASEAAAHPGALPWVQIGERALRKAEQSSQPRPLEPGRYVTIFEPSAVANLANLLRRALDQRTTDEGRSFLSRPGGENGLGEALFPSWLNVMSNPNDPRAPGPAFADNGLPYMPAFWIQEGAIKTLPCGRFWADKHKRGYQLPPANWLMSGGEGTVEDLIAKTERGVLVTSLWYIRGVDPRRLLYTGLTRDGLFLIEDGKIAHPLKNMRWNDSPLTVFGKAIDAGKPVRAVARGRRGGDTVVPPLRTAEFHFTSASDAV